MNSFEPILAGVQMRITSNPDEAWEIINQLTICSNCHAYTPIDLFSGRCDFPEGEWSFNVSNSNSCECFWAKNKIIKYWENKLVTMALDANGSSDICRKIFK